MDDIHIYIRGGLGDNNNVLITFLYRASGTNLWYKTCKLRNDICAMYSFLENYPVDDPSKPHDSTIYVDSVNKNKIIFAKDVDNSESKEMIFSYFKAPKAEKFIWVNENKDAPKGSFEKRLIYSNKLKQDIRVWVYTPGGQNENITYNLLTLLDGTDHIITNILNIDNVLDNVNNSKKVKPTMAVLIDNEVDDEKRFKNLTCSDDFAMAIAEEVIPWVRGNYNVSKEPSDNIISGFSLGGLMSTYTALTYPNIFGDVLSQSGSYWYAPKEEEPNMMKRKIEKMDKQPIKFYMNVGVLEPKPNMIDTNISVRDALISKGYEVVYEEFKSGHDYIYWGEKLAEGLVRLNG